MIPTKVQKKAGIPTLSYITLGVYVHKFGLLLRSRCTYTFGGK